jgi:hypothetical protein
MLQEIAITPSAFDSTSYSSAEVCDAHFQGIRQALLEWTITRDLRQGEWRQSVESLAGSMSPRARELWKKLLKQQRLFGTGVCYPSAPVRDEDWCAEALASNGRQPLLGILSSDTTKAAFSKDALVASIPKRGSALWWKQLEAGHPEGHQSGRKLNDYKSRLDLIFRYSRSLMFLDPYLDPTRKGYTEFLDLIGTALHRAAGPPLIEIHRCCTEGSGPGMRIVPNDEWEERFRSKWSSIPATGGIEVFIWSKDHDRHLISDLIGVHLGNGFDISDDAQDRISWSRLSRDDRDEMQRSVDPSVTGNFLIHRFRISP